MTERPAKGDRLLWIQGPRLAVALLVAVVAAGTAGYVLVEGWNAWDAFYMTVTTVATVGFREVHPLSTAGQAFTVLLVIVGVGTAFYSLSLLVAAVVDFVELAISSEHLELAMEQIRIVAGSSLAGRTIIEANLRQRFGVIVVGIQRPDGRMSFNPPPDAEMSPGDHLVVLGPPASLKGLESAADVPAPR